MGLSCRARPGSPRRRVGLADVTTTSPHAGPSGTFALGGSVTVTRLGYGAMRITGPGIWGEPADPDGAVRLLRRVAELGVNFIDTADSYGPFVSEELIRRALHPYDGITVATKGGLVRTGPDQWHPAGRPEYLRQCVEMSLGRLALIGLSEVGIGEIERARAIAPIASVQNLYNVVNRRWEPVVEYCEREGLAFIPWYPVATGDLARPGGRLAERAARIGATPAQVALAWLLRRSPVMLPIPGTASIAHLEENCAAATIVLSEAHLALLDAAGREEPGTA